MALIVEDGTGKTDAESYISVVDADAYHASIGNAAWAALTTERKEQLLRIATMYLLTTYRGAWKGWRIIDAQMLDWPRGNVYRDGELIAHNVIPWEVKQATAELALIANSTNLRPTAVRGKKKVKVGPLEVTYDGDSPVASKFVVAISKLGPLLNGVSAGFTAKLVRT